MADASWRKKASVARAKALLAAEEERRRREAVRLGYADDPVGYCRDVLKAGNWWKQDQILEALIRPPHRVMAESANGIGKCIDAEEYLPLADGTLAKAADLIGRHFVVLSWDQETGEQRPAAAFAEDNGVEPVYRIRTDSGRSILRTGNHPLWSGEEFGGPGKPTIPELRGWKKASELKEGDLLLVPTVLRQHGRQRAPEDHVKLAGYLLGDGGIVRAITFTQEEGRPKDEFREIAVRLGGECRDDDHLTVRVKSGGPERSRNEVLELVRSWGILGKKSKAKQFPEWAWRLPDDQLGLLLNRLFACDGWAYRGKEVAAKNRKTKFQNTRIGIGLASERLIRDIELAMLRLGIRGLVRPRTNRCNGKSFKSWEWTIYESPMIERFAEKVGVFGKEEAVAATVAVAVNRSPAKMHKWRTRNAPEGYRWDRVKSVELIGERPTVAICVPGAETFVTTFVEHNTRVAGAALSWFFKTHNPGIAIATGPRFEQVQDLTFKEVREFLSGEPGLMPRQPMVFDTARHYLKGTTATDANAFQGAHEESVFLLFEEASGVAKQYWEAARGILAGGERTYQLAILNPTDPDSHAHLERSAVDEDGNPQWTVIRISAFEHPNILAEVRGMEALIPGAVRLAQLKSNMASDESWGRWVAQDEFDPAGQGDVDCWDGREYGLDSPQLPDDALAGVIEHFPRRYWRPGPVGESRILGRYPRMSAYAIFAADAFERAARNKIDPGVHDPIEIGCDVARYGEDLTVLHVQRGGKALEHVRRSKMNTAEITALAKERAGYWADRFSLTKSQVVARIDDGGIGGGVTDQADGWNFVAVNCQTVALAEHRYPKKRDEMLFHFSARLANDQVDLSSLGRETIHELTKQASKNTYTLDSQGRRRALNKDKVKDALGRSPDDLDGACLAYYRYMSPGASMGGAMAPTREHYQRAEARVNISGRPENPSREFRPRRVEREVGSWRNSRTSSARFEP